MMSHMAMQPSLVPDWFEPFRANALQSLGAPLVDDGPKKPVVVYLDRNRNVSLYPLLFLTSLSELFLTSFLSPFRLQQSQSPRFNLESHNGLIQALKSISGRAEVHQSVLMNMRKEEIVKLMSTATVSRPSEPSFSNRVDKAQSSPPLLFVLQIVISPHCAEFIHTMWMPTTPFSTVMEIFDSGSFVREYSIPFLRFRFRRVVEGDVELTPLLSYFFCIAGDNQLLSEMLHHEHLIVREDGILPKEQWQLMDVEKGRGERWDVSSSSFSFPFSGLLLSQLTRDLFLSFSQDDIVMDPKIILDRVVRILDEYDSAALRGRATEYGDV